MVASPPSTTVASCGWAKNVTLARTLLYSLSRWAHSFLATTLIYLLKERIAVTVKMYKAFERNFPKCTRLLQLNNSTQTHSIEVYACTHVATKVQSQYSKLSWRGNSLVSWIWFQFDLFDVLHLIIVRLGGRGFHFIWSYMQWSVAQWHTYTHAHVLR